MAPGKKSKNSKKQANPSKADDSQAAGLQSDEKGTKESSTLSNRQERVDLSEAQGTDEADAAATAIASLSIDNKPESAADGAEKNGENGENEGENLPLPWEYNRCLKSLLETLGTTNYFVSEHEKAMETFELLEGMVNEDDKWTTAMEMVDRLMTVNAEIATKYPHETTPRNIIHRFRKIILEEYITAVKELQPSPDIGGARNYFESIAVHNEVLNIDLPDIPEGIDVKAIVGKVKASTKAAVMEYRTEIDTVPRVISQYGETLIMEGDVVMTYHFCPVTALFFRNAAKRCSFTLHIIESQPMCFGHLMVDHLVDSGIEIFIVPDGNVGTLMASMTKVVIPCIAVLYDGSLKTISLAGVIAMMACLHKKPLYAVAASYQFTGSAIPNLNVLLDQHFFRAPIRDAPYVSLKFDSVKPDQINWIVSNPGIITVSEVSSRVTELYNPRLEKDEDY